MTKRKKRYRWLLTLLSLLLFLLAACSGTSGGGAATGAETDAPEPRLILIRGGSSDYRIVVPQSEDAMFDVGYALAAKLRTLTGVNLQVVPDRYEPVAHEILLGRTNRSDGADESLLSGLRDYIIRQKDGRLFLWGLSTQSVSAAVETLAGLFLVEGDTLTVPAVLDRVYPGGVSFASLREGGYVIVAGDGSAASAATLQAAIEQKTGYRPAVAGTSAAPVPNEILIGRTGRTESRQVQETLDSALDWAIEAVGERIVLVGGSDAGTEKAVTALCGRLDTFLFREDIRIAEDYGLMHDYGKEEAVEYISSIRSDPEYTVRESKLNIERARIFTPNGDWYYNHHPFVTFFQGRLWAFWSAGHLNEDDCGQRIMMASSENFRDWEVSVLVDSIPGEASELVCFCKGCYVADGKLRVFWQSYEYEPSTLRKNPDGTPLRPLDADSVRWQKGVFYTETADGEHWTEPVSMGTIYGGNLSPEALISGRLLWAGYGSLSWSDDPSAVGTWENIRLGYGSGVGKPRLITESGFYQTADGVIYLLSRTNDQYLYAAASYDNGSTWTGMYPTAFPDTSNKFEFGRLPDGRYYYLGGISRSRSEIVLQTSTDGMLFDHWYTLATAPYRQMRPDGMYKNGTYGYMTSCTDDTYLYVIYSLGKESLEILRVPLSDIK